MPKTSTEVGLWRKRNAQDFNRSGTLREMPKTSTEVGLKILPKTSTEVGLWRKRKIAEYREVMNRMEEMIEKQRRSLMTRRAEAKPERKKRGWLTCGCQAYIRTYACIEGVCG